MKRTAFILAALVATLAADGETVRTATEGYVARRIAAAMSGAATSNDLATVARQAAKDTATAAQNATNYTDSATNEVAIALRREVASRKRDALDIGVRGKPTAENGGVFILDGDMRYTFKYSIIGGEGYWRSVHYAYMISQQESGFILYERRPVLLGGGNGLVEICTFDLAQEGYYAVSFLRDGVTHEMVGYTNTLATVADIPPAPDLSRYATTGAVAEVSSKVETLETWAIGDETSLTVREAGTTNATLEIAYTNKTLYASANEHTNTLNAAKAYTNGKAVEIAAATDAALAGKANRAWGETTSGGAPSPEDMLVIEKKKVTLTGGGNFSYLESSTGGYWVMSVSFGSMWTLESLADAQNPDVPATATFRDADGNAVYTVTSTGSREVYAAQGEQYISVANVNGNDVITLTYPVAASEPPTCQFIPALEMLKTGGDYAEATAANWPDYISSVAWSGQSGAWVCTITMNGKPGRGFFRAKYTKEGTVYTNFTKPLGLSTVTIGKVTYTVTVETVNGKKLMVLTEN